MSMFSTQMRYTGLSGVDTASMVDAIMRAESLKYDNLKKIRQRTVWKNEAYKTHVNALNAFNKNFIDIMGANSLRKSSTFLATTAKVTLGGVESKAATIRTNSSSMTGSYDLSIQQLAQVDSYRSTEKIKGSIVGTETFDASKLVDGDSINVTLDGRTVQITFDNRDLYASVDGDGNPTGARLDTAQFVNKLNEKLKTTFGTTGSDAKVLAKLDGGKLAFDVNGNHTLRVTEASGRPISAAGSAVTWDETPADEGGKVGNQYAFNVNIGGETKTIEFAYKDTIDETVKAINEALRSKENGINNLVVSYDNGFQFTAMGTTENITISGAGLDELGLSGGFALEPTSVLTTRMGIASGATNALQTSQTMRDALGVTSGQTISMNGIAIEVEPDMTLRDFMNKLNASGAGVRMSYDTITETFRLESAESGARNAIRFDNPSTAAFFENVFKIDNSADSHIQKAQDAEFMLNGEKFVRESNNVSVGGLGLTLNEVTKPGENLKIEISKNTDAVFDVIKNFVHAYNKLIEDINGAVNDKRARTSKYSYYEPLTDDQRQSMKDSEIVQWEAKAKEGILYRDQTLSDITSRMRTELYKSVDLGDGKKISLYEIGITTSSKVSDQGMLVIDEDKLRAAIENRGEDISTLFTQDDFGIAERMNTVINNAIGLNGSLTQIVGSDFYASTQNDNQMYHLMKRQDDQLADMLIMLRRKEEAYYLRFSRMEAAMMNANSQMTYLQSMMGI